MDTMTEPRVLTIGECEIRVWPAYLETVWADGLKVPAAANDDAESIARAHELGYSGDTWRMSLEHELSHTLLDVARGYPYSRVLRGVAVREAGGSKEDVISRDASDYEEGLVLDVQRWVQLGILTPRLVESELDLEGLKGQLLEMTT
jgi:hypothetical protein